MYRARVEAVSGLQVRAGGKWLTCIGNRVVRAGDMVWTDGRCVYGHDRESQTPLVIAPKEDLAIPIQIADYSSAEVLFTYRKNDLNQVSSGKFINRLLNDAKGHVFCFSADAANIDKSGNIYILDGSYANYEYEQRNSSAPKGNTFVYCNNQNPHITIKKNGTVVKEVSLEDILESTAATAKENSSAWSGMPQPFTYSAPTEHGNTHGDAVFDVHSDVREAQLLYSFIENEDSWGFICEVNTYYRCYLDWWAWGEGHYPGEPLGAYTVGVSNVSRFYYIDSKGKKTVLYQEDTVWNIRTLYKTRYSIVDLYDPQIGTFINRATSNTENIPIQDGYYFKLEYSHKPSWYGSSSELDVAYTVYSPFGEYLYSSGGSDWFFHKWAFTVCKLWTWRGAI